MLPLLTQPDIDEDYVTWLCRQFGLTVSEHVVEGWHLTWHNGALVLRNSDMPQQGDIIVDFASGAASYRRLHGGGKSEAIAKACGLNKKTDVSIIDATAGLGRDAFVLASIGATVTMVERNPAVAALLADGLRRAQLEPALGSWLPQRLQLQFAGSASFLPQHAPVDVVYLDPMFPTREKSAKVKKEMQAFHQVVGSDTDADDLLTLALSVASKRVVVKRPGYAGYLNNTAPTMSVTGKNNRFDVYVKAAMV